ncbi:hypothetical protein QUB30_22145 [Microcoleus sp. BROC3]
MSANYFARTIRSSLVKVLGYRAIARDCFCMKAAGNLKFKG